MLRSLLSVTVTLLLSSSLALAGRTLNGTTQVLTGATTAVTTPPFTVCAWARPASETVNLLAYSLHSASTSFRLQFDGAAASDPVKWNSFGAGGNAITETLVDFASNTWYHACGSEITTSSRAVWVNGANKISNATLVNDHVTPTTQRIGAGDGFGWFNGSLAQVCVWNAALTDLEVAALAQGIACHKVRPLNLVACPRLLSETSPEPDGCGILTWTLTAAPTVSTTNPPLVPWWGGGMP